MGCGSCALVWSGCETVCPSTSGFKIRGRRCMHDLSLCVLSISFQDWVTTTPATKQEMVCEFKLLCHAHNINNFRIVDEIWRSALLPVHEFVLHEPSQRCVGSACTGKGLRAPLCQHRLQLASQCSVCEVLAVFTVNGPPPSRVWALPRRVFVVLKVFVSGVLLWPVSKLGSTPYWELAKSPAAVEWSFVSDLAEWSVVPTEVHSPLHRFLAKEKGPLHPLWAVTGDKIPINIWQADHGFPFVPEAAHGFLKSSHPSHHFCTCRCLLVGRSDAPS